MLSKYWSYAAITWVGMMGFFFGCVAAPYREGHPRGLGFWVYLLLLPVLGYAACALIAVGMGLARRVGAAPTKPDA